MNTKQRKLTPKQRDFAYHYVYGAIPGNASEAAKQAGYQGSARTLAKTGYDNLQLPHVSLLVQRMTRERDTETQDEREKNAQFLVSVRDNPAESTKDRIAAAAKLALQSGWNTQTIQLETSARQRQMDEAARRAAQEASRLLTNTRLLPDGTTVPLPPVNVDRIIDSEPVSAEPDDTHQM